MLVENGEGNVTAQRVRSLTAEIKAESLDRRDASSRTRVVRLELRKLINGMCLPKESVNVGLGASVIPALVPWRSGLLPGPSDK
jgi:hypothetical protein